MAITHTADEAWAGRELTHEQREHAAQMAVAKHVYLAYTMASCAWTEFQANEAWTQLNERERLDWLTAATAAKNFVG